MWDIDQIVARNNQASIEYMMAGRAVDVAQSPTPQTWTLTLLAKKLQVGPPLLSYLLESFTNYDTLEGFIELVRKFLPEHEKKILSESRNQQVYRFCYLFGKKYYPLPSYRNGDHIGDFLNNMPVELMGMSYTAYHDLVMRPGYLLLLSLVIYPYEGDERDEEDDRIPFDPVEIPKSTKYKPTASDISWVKSLIENLADGGEWIAPMGFSVIKVDDHTIQLKQAIDTPDVKETIRRTLLIAERAGITAKFSRTGRKAEEKISGARIPLLETVKRMVGADLVKLIPKNGWTKEVLHTATDGTRYDGVGHFADWVCQATGCTVLDSNYEDCHYQEGDTEPYFKWSERNVKLLTEEWPKAQEYRKKIDHIVQWLEANPISRFQELLEFLAPKAVIIPMEKVNSPYDPTERWCPLEQHLPGEEDEENGDE